MRCDAALERLLEADPRVLRGEGEGELARHVAGCPRCARVAAALRAETEAVDRALGDYAATRDADAAADAVLAAVRTADPDVIPLTGARESGPGAAPGGRGRWARRAWIPVAAAAALTGVLVLSLYEAPFPAGQAPPAPSLEPRVSVTPPANRRAAIMETENPNITIVWLYEEEES